MTQQNYGHFLDNAKLPSGTTRFWLIRHALVDREARRTVYGSLDVALCAEDLAANRASYQALARRLPEEAAWYVSPLSRTTGTAQAIFEAGYGERPLRVEPRFIEQSMGEWHGLQHHEVTGKLRQAAHKFWSLAATEQPPGGDSMLDVCARVGHALDEMAVEHEGRDTVIVGHGGVIRAALSHALTIHPDNALRFSIQNLSVTILEHIEGHWRVVAVNEMPQVG